MDTTHSVYVDILFYGSVLAAGWIGAGLHTRWKKRRSTGRKSMSDLIVSAWETPKSKPFQDWSITDRTTGKPK